MPGSLLGAGIVMTFLCGLVLADQPIPSNSFPGTLIFAPTPEIGRKWSGGIRTQLGFANVTVETDTGPRRMSIPSLVLDADFNFADLFTIGLFYVGIPQIRSVKDSVSHDTSTFADNFTILTLKSHPYSLVRGPLQYKAGAGLTFYGARTALRSSAQPENDYEMKDGSIGLFVAQSARLFGFNYVNLYSSMALRNQKNGNPASVYPSFSFVPGYRLYLGKRQWCSLGIEYELFNSVQLPMKSVQILGSADQLPVENFNQQYFGFVFYGFQVAARHLWAGLTIGNHWSFTGPVIVVTGVGYSF